jgi:hypothetical protein
MASKGKPSTSVQQADNKGVVVGGDAVGNIIQTGDHNTVNQNFFQRIFITLFKPDTETLDQRNRRILLNHVENFWVKGVLEKSLHGAAIYKETLPERLLGNIQEKICIHKNRVFTFFFQF